ERRQSDRQHDRPKRIEAFVLLALGVLLCIKVQRGEEEQQADGYIDIKDPAPGQILGDKAANSWPRSHAQRDDHRIQAQGQSALMAGKGTGDHRHIDRKDERPTNPLEKTSEDEKQQRRGETRKRRSEDKNNQS